MKKILLFSRDPGGANTLVPLVDPLKNAGYHVLLFGKDNALLVYKNAKMEGLNITDRVKEINERSIQSFLKKEQPDLILTGTSANDMTERYIWKAADALSIPSFAILDQWVNYGVRFSPYKVSEIEKYNEHKVQTFLPTKVFVMDQYAKRQMNKEGVDNDRIIVSGQPHFDFCRSEAKKISKTQITRFKKNHNIDCDEFVITFASEPIVETYGHSEALTLLGYTERTILKEFLFAIRKIANKEKKFAVFIKPHPKEDVRSLRKFIRKYRIKNAKIQLLLTESRYEIMRSSDIVCGMTSMFLIEAAILDRPIVSIEIGRKQKNGFILEEQRILKPMLTQFSVVKALRKSTSKRCSKKYHFLEVSNPAKNIINFLSHYRSEEI